MSETVHRVCIVDGRVQGVGYRAHVVRLASRFPVAGTVANLEDGTVRVGAQGPREEVEAFLAEVLVPAWPIHPRRVRRTEELPPDPHLLGFEVVRGPG